MPADADPRRRRRRRRSPRACGAGRIDAFHVRLRGEPRHRRDHALVRGACPRGASAEMVRLPQAAPFDEGVARAAAASGCTSWTLAVASADLSDEEGPYGEADVSRFMSICREQGIKVAVDLIVGLPGESFS